MEDFGVFLAVWNRLQGYTTPKIHFRISTWLQSCVESGRRRLLLMAFRASGKSSILALFSAWLLYRDPDLRILVLSAETSLSIKMVRNIRGIVQKHPLTRFLIPENLSQWSSDRFTVNRGRELRDPSVLAKGITSNITGIRADVIICDDVEVPNTCDTVGKRADLRERLLENEYILVPGGLQIYAGTPHSYFSIYADEPRREIGEEEIFLKGYERLKIPLIDENGNSVWPERYTKEDIELLRVQTGPGKFASQMMLEPVNIAEGRLDPDLLVRYAGELEYSEAQKQAVLSLEGRRLVSCSAWWDPAFGSALGDGSVLAVVYTDEEGDYWLHRVFYIRVNNFSDEDEATQQCRQIAEIAREFYIPSISLEINGIGRFLPAILKRELAIARVPASVVEVSSHRPKDIRIVEAFDAVMAARALHVHESVFRTPFVMEMRDWRPGVSGGHDDGLDAVAGALSVQPVRIRRSYFAGERGGWQGSAGFFRAKSNFDV